MLFFGCRHERRDFIYRKDFEELVQKNTLHYFYTAFSRDTNEKIYVQHRMEEQSEKIAKLLLQENAVFYLCG